MPGLSFLGRLLQWSRILPTSPSWVSKSEDESSLILDDENELHMHHDASNSSSGTHNLRTPDILGTCSSSPSPELANLVGKAVFEIRNLGKDGKLSQRATLKREATSRDPSSIRRWATHATLMANRIDRTATVGSLGPSSKFGMPYLWSCPSYSSVRKSRIRSICRNMNNQGMQRDRSSIINSPPPRNGATTAESIPERTSWFGNSSNFVIQGGSFQQGNNHFINTTAGWINLLLLSSSGPVKIPVGSCATALQSLEIASDTILSGKAKVMITGSFADISEEGSYEFANMKTTSNAGTEFAMG
ncbi:hypothetical protein CVT26_009711, partial [Gymnopilus dilepis]